MGKLELQNELLEIDLELFELILINFCGIESTLIRINLNCLQLVVLKIEYNNKICPFLRMFIHDQTFGLFEPILPHSGSLGQSIIGHVFPLYLVLNNPHHRISPLRFF